jgi:hypothetical protein
MVNCCTFWIEGNAFSDMTPFLPEKKAYWYGWQVVGAASQAPVAVHVNRSISCFKKWL